MRPVDANTGIPFVMRYHRSFVNAFRRASSNAKARLMPAWKNSLPTTMFLVTRANRATLGGLSSSINPRNSFSNCNTGLGGGSVAAVLPRAVSQSTMSRHSKNFCEFSLYKCM